MFVQNIDREKTTLLSTGKANKNITAEILTRVKLWEKSKKIAVKVLSPNHVPATDKAAVHTSKNIKAEQDACSTLSIASSASGEVPIRFIMTLVLSKR
jgi:hypothetical protein